MSFLEIPRKAVKGERQHSEYARRAPRPKINNTLTQNIPAIQSTPANLPAQNIHTIKNEISERIKKIQQNLHIFHPSKNNLENQIITNATKIASTLLPLHKIYSDNKEFADLQKDFIRDAALKGLDSFFSKETEQSENGTTNQILLECIACDLGLTSNLVTYVDCYLQCLAFGFFELLRKFSSVNLIGICNATKIQHSHTEGIPNLQIVRHVIGKDLDVVYHDITCYNCKNGIYGCRYNCDQMAARNFCAQCARRMRVGNEGLIRVEEIGFSFSEIRSQVESSVDIKLADTDLIANPSIDTEEQISNVNVSQQSSTESIVDSGVELQNMIKDIIGQINTFVERTKTQDPAKNLSRRWHNVWRVQLEKLQKRAELPNISIAVAAESGAGKSSLLNAVVGQLILPTSCTSEACSSGVVELIYWPKNYYEVEITFIKHGEWEKEKDILLKSYDESYEHDESYELEPESYKILKSIYGSDLSRTVEEKFTAKLPIYVESHLGKRKKFQLKTPDAVHSVLAHFITVHDDISLWPIVSKVTVWGPFIALSSGARLVDLPGSNDTCKARVNMMDNYLNKCHYIWAIADITRSATDAGSHKLISDRFLTKLSTSDRMWASLAHISTRSDILSTREIITKLGLPRDTDPLGCALARNQYTKKCVRKNLINQIEKTMHKKTTEWDSDEVQLSQGNRQIPIFTVSARNYLQLMGVDSSSNDSLFTNIEDTEIPLLQEFLYGCTRHRSNVLPEISKNVDRMLESMLHELNVSVDKGASERLKDTFNEAFKDFKILFTETDIDKNIAQILVGISQKLTDIVVVYSKQSTIAEISSIWKNMHISTLRAACVRDGTYHNVNFNYAIGKRLLTGLIPEWKTFFSKLTREVLNLVGKLKGKVNDFHEKLEGILQKEGITRIPKNSFNTLFLEDTLHEGVAAIAIKANEEERKCCEVVEECIQESMCKAYSLASNEIGKGSKQRMVDILTTEIESSAAMFRRANEKVIKQLQKIASTIDGLLQRINAEMSEGLLRHYKFYWDEIKEKDEFEELIRNIRDQQLYRDNKLKQALRAQEEQRENVTKYSNHTYQTASPPASPPMSTPVSPPANKPASQSEKRKHTQQTSDTEYEELHDSRTTKKKKSSRELVPASTQNDSQYDWTKWSVEEVVAWIRQQPELEEYADKFRQQKIRGCILANLTDQMLENNIGMVLGDRLMFTSMVQQLINANLE